MLGLNENCYTWIIFVIVKQQLVQSGRIDGPTEYSSYILAAIESERLPASSGGIREFNIEEDGLRQFSRRVERF
jgi:hypothetical protein